MKILLFLVVLLVACCTPPVSKKTPKNTSTPPKEKSSYPVLPEVNGEEAMKLVEKQISFGQRHVNSEGARKCAEFIADFAKELGYEVEVDTWTEGKGVNSRTFRNIICTRKGQGSQYVICGSHYDTKFLPNAPKFAGANDAGSSTAALLQIMKEISQSDQWQHHCNMRFIFFDGEEAFHFYSATDGLNGSRRYAKRIYDNGEYTKCRAMLLMDMIGDKDLKLTIPSNSSENLIYKTRNIARHLKLEKYFSVMEVTGFLDDHLPFIEIGIQAIDLIDFEYGVKTEDNGGGSYWHTNEDTIDKISADSLRKSGTIFKYLMWDLSDNPIKK